ncbi:MAG: hypothetical protein ABIW85_06130 [Variovorax sp.]
MSLLLAIGCTGAAYAWLALAQSKNCMSCHAGQRKMLGPSFKDVAARYRQSGAAQRLAEKFVHGRSGA